MILDKDTLKEYLHKANKSYSFIHFDAILQDFNLSYKDIDSIIEAYLEMLEDIDDKQHYLLCSFGKDDFYFLIADYGNSFTFDEDKLYIYNPYKEKFELCYEDFAFRVPEWFTYTWGHMFGDSRGYIHELYFPDNIKVIDVSACQNVRDLFYVKLPNNLTTIESAAFYRCRELETVDTPYSLEVIKDDAFSSCLSLKSIEPGNNVRYLGRAVFENCESLTVKSDNLYVINYCRQRYIDYESENYADEDLEEKLIKKGNKWQVQSEKGRNMGTYNTKEEAKRRLKQVEYFKHIDKFK